MGVTDETKRKQIVKNPKNIDYFDNFLDTRLIVRASFLLLYSSIYIYTQGSKIRLNKTTLRQKRIQKQQHVNSIFIIANQ